MIKIKKRSMLHKKFSGVICQHGREFLVRDESLIGGYQSLCRDAFLGGNGRFGYYTKQEIIDTYISSWGFEFIHFDSYKELFSWLSSCETITKQQVFGFENASGERGFVRQQSVRDENLWVLKLAKEINTQKEEYKHRGFLHNIVFDPELYGINCTFHTFYNINDLFKWISEGPE